MVNSPDSGSNHHQFTGLLILLLAVVVASLLRLVGLDQSPPGLFRDELEKGYTALQLWHTGRHGILGAEGVQRSPLLPIFIEVFEGHDRTSAIYQYITAPFVGIGGLNYWTTRIPAAIAGILGVVVVGGFAWRLIGPAAGITAALLLAIHPTGVLFSRWAQQGIMQAMLVPAGFWILLEAERANPRHRRALGVVAACVLIVAAWAYAPGRLVVPLMAAAWVGWRLLGRMSGEGRQYLKDFLPAAILFAVLWIPLAVYTVGPGGGRLERVGVGGSDLGGTVTTFIANYFSFWTPRFWVIVGDANPRHHLPGAGYAGPVVVLALIVSLVMMIRGARQEGPRRALANPVVVLLVWLLLAPVAAALTREGNPHALRAIILVPVVCLYAASFMGTSLGTAILRSRVAVVVLLVIWSLGAGLTGWGVWRMASGPGAPWEAGTVEAVRYAIGKGGTPWLSAEVPYAAYVALFAEETDPAILQEEGLGALRTQLVAPGESPESLHPGDSWITTPGRGLPLHFHMAPVVIYERGATGARTILPPGKEHLYPELDAFELH